MQLLRTPREEILAAIERKKIEERRELYEGSLYEFLKSAWKYIDPSDWTDGWCLEAICEHLEAVADGEINRLLINIPPRCGKSSLISVAFPAWVWAQRFKGPISGPGVQFLHASYAEKLSMRDSVKCRRLIKSPWYQGLWGDRYSLMSDQDTKHRFSNDQGGERLITSISGTATGEGAMCFVIDDANAANEAESEATITTTNDWWDQSARTRLNNAKTGAFIGVQQRLAENDWTGHILESGADVWDHVCLPMRFEGWRSSLKTSIGWSDPRTIEGELLWPDRFSEDEVSSLERTLGIWGSSGQLQQSPSPRGGGIIKEDWWRRWDDKAFPPMDYIIASLDTAYTEKEENDPSAMTVWGVFTTDPVAVQHRWMGADGRPQYADRSFTEEAPKVMLMHAWRERLEFHDLVKRAMETCSKLKVDKLVIENKAAGISTAQEIRRLMRNETVRIQLYNPGNLDKQARLYSVQHLFSEGVIFAPDREWAEMTIREVSQFPKGRYRDLTDTVSQALRHLRDIGMLIRSPERAADIEEGKRYTKPAEPLYPS